MEKTGDRVVNLTYKTPLILAIHYWFDKIVNLLLRYGADPKFTRGCEFIPLELAKSKGNKMNADLKSLEDDWRRRSSKHPDNTTIKMELNISTEMRLLASNKAIVQMLEDAIRVR